MDEDRQDIIIYNTPDGKASVSLHAKDGMVWMSQNQLAKLFETSKQNVTQHIANILKEKELDENSVVKKFFTTAADGKEYDVTFYALNMIIAVGFRVRSKRGTQFRKLKKARSTGSLKQRAVSGREPTPKTMLCDPGAVASRKRLAGNGVMCVSIKKM